MLKEKLQHLIAAAIDHLQKDGTLPENTQIQIAVERTKNRKFGDFSSNAAMLLAKHAKRKPTELAQLIVDNLAANPVIETIEVVAPGFINFYLTDIAFVRIINDILEHKEQFGRSNIGTGKHVNVEFVSSNPTGPLHVGHGRGAAYGDAVASLLQTIGYQVDREYYVNDAGRQMHILATSIWLRYLSIKQNLPHFPCSGYQGEYVLAIAKQLYIKHGDLFIRPFNELFLELPNDKNENGDAEIYIDQIIERAKKMLGEENYSLIFDFGLQSILLDIKDDLSNFGITFQQWFSERSLTYNGDLEKGIELLRTQGYVYDKDGALWFKATDFGDEKDRVVIKENGQTTYFASDIAYHLNKYERGYTQIIDVFGADHHGYAPRINAFLKALKLDPAKLKILLVQFAVLYRQKQKIQMSTRSGEFVTLRTLVSEVGKDATRFFYLMRKNDQHLDFDLDLAKSQSTDNPVYYIQYAHARICSVLRQLAEKLLTWDKISGLANLQLLQETTEQNLIYCLHNYTDVLQNAAENYAPHILTHYLWELANCFHTYYNAHRFIDAAEPLRSTRLCLIVAVRQLLANGLAILGITAPEIM